MHDAECPNWAETKSHQTTQKLILDQDTLNSFSPQQIHTSKLYTAPYISTLGSDKVSVVTHTCPHKSLRKVKVTICNPQAASLLYVWPNV